MVMQRLRIGFVEKFQAPLRSSKSFPLRSLSSGGQVGGQARILQSESPFDVFPSVQRHVFPERKLSRDLRRQADVAGVREPVLDRRWDERVAVLFEHRVDELPARLFQPAHDRRDAAGGVPGGESQNGKWKVESGK